jgi:hypothetical protein
MGALSDEAPLELREGAEDAYCGQKKTEPRCCEPSGERGPADMINEVYGWKVNSDFTEN